MCSQGCAVGCVRFGGRSRGVSLDRKGMCYNCTPLGERLLFFLMRAKWLIAGHIQVDR
jgi:hypothetical protein